MNTIEEVSGDAARTPKVLKGLGLVYGGVRGLLRAEGAAVVAVAFLAYRSTGSSWLLFAVLFLAPDVSFAGYLAGQASGAALYNLFHSYIGPLALMAVAMRFSWLEPYSLIWIAHIGFDRCVGYGLKYGTGFGDTHLGKMGRIKVAGN